MQQYLQNKKGLVQNVFDKVYNEFLKLADAKKEIYDDDIQKIVKAANI